MAQSSARPYWNVIPGQLLNNRGCANPFIARAQRLGFARESENEQEAHVNDGDAHNHVEHSGVRRNQA
jgi:hypothetical protein